jgi:hypothetical protein
VWHALTPVLSWWVFTSVDQNFGSKLYNFFTTWAFLVTFQNFPWCTQTNPLDHSFKTCLQPSKSAENGLDVCMDVHRYTVHGHGCARVCMLVPCASRFLPLVGTWLRWLGTRDQGAHGSSPLFQLVPGGGKFGSFTSFSRPLVSDEDLSSLCFLEAREGEPREASAEPTLTPREIATWSQWRPTKISLSCFTQRKLDRLLVSRLGDQKFLEVEKLHFFFLCYLWLHVFMSTAVRERVSFL